MARASINVADDGASSDRREEILTVASQVLLTTGLTLSMKDIAAELGITYNALYHHFKSRDDLLLHCFLRSARLMDEALVSAGDEGTGLDKVMRFLQLFIESTRATPTPPGRFVAALGVDAQRVLVGRTRAMRYQLVGFLEEGITDGSIAPCDPLVTAVWILHTLCWWPEELRHKRTGDEIAAGVFGMIRRALTA